jgi:hypothetical protein
MTNEPPEIEERRRRFEAMPREVEEEADRMAFSRSRK